jgi:hypothetical protein
LIRKYDGEYTTEVFHQHAAEPAAHRRLYEAVRGHWRWSGRPATRHTRLWSSAFRAGCAGASSPIDLVRAVAHPVLEATGATVAGSQDAVDERVLLPVPMFSRKNRGPFNFSFDPIIGYPCSDDSFGKLACFIDVQVAGNFRNTIIGQIIGKRRLFQPVNLKLVICSVQDLFE